MPIDPYRRSAAWRGHRLFPARYLHDPEALIGLVDKQRAWGLYPLFSELRCENSLCDSLRGFLVRHMVSMVAVGILPEREWV